MSSDYRIFEEARRRVVVPSSEAPYINTCFCCLSYVNTFFALCGDAEYLKAWFVSLDIPENQADYEVADTVAHASRDDRGWYTIVVRMCKECGAKYDVDVGPREAATMYTQEADS